MGWNGMGRDASERDATLVWRGGAKRGGEGVWGGGGEGG